MCKVGVSKNTLCMYLFVKIHMKCFGMGAGWPSHLSEQYALSSRSGEGKEVQRALCQCVYSEARLTIVFFMFLHFVSLCCVYSVYNGQMSPNLQHLVFLGVKEVASV